jgi:PAS domain S-box-containing protein
MASGGARPGMTMYTPLAMPSWVTRSVVGAALALAYFATAHIGLGLARAADQVTTVWPPTGIALAALLLYGTRYWPAIWLGAFVFNVATVPTIWAAAGIAIGNTLEPLAAAWALSRIAGFHAGLRRIRDVITFILVGGATTVISSSLGVATLCAEGTQPWANYWPLWLDWTLGDLLGVLVVAPAVLSVARVPSRWRVRPFVETAFLILLAIIVTEVVFGEVLTSQVSAHPLEFVVFPLVIVAAVRLGQPATSLVILATSALTIGNTILGQGPFATAPLREGLVLVQVFIGMLASSGLLLAAAIIEQRVAEGRRATAQAVGQVLAASTSITDAAPPLLKTICDHVGCQVGALWTLDSDRRELRCFHVWTEKEDAAAAFTEMTRNSRFSPGVGLPGQVLTGGEAMHIADTLMDESFPRAGVARAAGLRGGFALPIRLGDDILGVVEFYHRTEIEADADLLASLSTVGGQIGQFIARTRVEQEMRDSEARSRAILESAQDAIITMDHRGTVTEFNAAAERMFGHLRADVLGREMADLLIPGNLRDEHRQGLQRYLSTGKGPFINRRIQTIALRADGTEFPAEVSITTVTTSGPPMFTGFVRDVTERVRADRERRELLDSEQAARREAEEANRAKDQFLATLSHELRTPLTAIAGWTRMLLDGTLDESKTRRALQTIDRNAQLQVQLVADLLDVSRIITGRLRLDVRPVGLGSIIAASLDAIRPAADAKQITLRSVLQPSALMTLGDPMRLQQIVWNLLSNAVKFTPQGGRVQVDLRDEGERVCIRVEDSGPGIPADFLPFVFDRFRQADGSSTRRHGGLGLGLAIVRHLVELHGGTVRVDGGGNGTGAVFSIELPRTKDPGGHTPEPLNNPATDPIPAGQARPLVGCRVLVVDDEPDTLELVTAMLSEAGAEILTATSVSEALHTLRSLWPDVLLADLGLPGEDGYRLIHQVRALEVERAARLPAAALTAYGREEDRKRALQEGFDLHLAKPAEPSRVVQTVVTLWKRD